MERKDDIRAGIWQIMKEKQVARFPGPQGRIPNFVGSERCAHLLSQLPSWQQAKRIKANPDSPQRAVRQRALEEGKIVYMAVPRLQSMKPFIELDPRHLKVSPFHASSIKGATKYGRPVAMEKIKKDPSHCLRIRGGEWERSAGGQGRRLFRPGICSAQGRRASGRQYSNRHHHPPLATPQFGDTYDRT